MTIKTLSIDIGKTIFHLVGLDGHGRVALRKRASRGRLLKLTVNLPVCRLDRQTGSTCWPCIGPANRLVSHAFLLKRGVAVGKGPGNLRRRISSSLHPERSESLF